MGKTRNPGGRGKASEKKSDGAEVSKKSQRMTDNEKAAREKCFMPLAQALTECQEAKSHALYLSKMRQLYYSNFESRDEASLLQKAFCAQSFKLMAAVFTLAKNESLQNAMTFFKKMVGSFGLEEDMREARFPIQDLPPFYILVSKVILQYHRDKAVSIRQKLTELAGFILTQFHDHPSFIQEQGKSSKSYKTMMFDMLTHRYRDKHHSVRVEAVQCLQYYIEDKEARAVLSFSAQKDTSPEVRRAAVKILGSVEMIKSSLFYDFAFDQSESVRIEAFKRLSRIPISKFKPAQRRKLVFWGLSQTSHRLLSIVKKELLPAWVAQAGSAITLIHKLEISARPQFVNILIDSLHPNTDEETLESVDLSFLSDDKVIPLDNLQIHVFQYWITLCRKFENVPECISKLLPEPIIMCNYILSIVEVIHEEERQKMLAENRDDEFDDYNLFLCLSLAFRISELITFEECSMRKMQEVIQTVLLDPFVDDYIVLIACVDLAFKITPALEFASFMTKIFVVVFEESDGSSPNNASRISVNKNVRRTSRVVNDNVVPAEDMDFENAPIPNASQSNLTPVRRPLLDSNAGVPAFITSTPFVDPAVARATYQLEELRKQTRMKTLHRIRLQDAIERAEAHRNIEEAVRLRRDYNKVCEDERELEAQLEKAALESNVGIITAQGIAVPRAVTPRPRSPSIPITPIRANESANVDTDVTQGGSSILKGLEIITRYLILTRKLNPLIQKWFESSISLCLEDEDTRIRSKIMNLIALVAILDKSRAQQYMILMIKGVLLEEDKATKWAIFKGVVDLLLEYDFDAFRAPEIDNSDLPVLPRAFNDPNATTEQLEKEFTDFVASFSGASETELSNRVIATIKLVIRGRIKDVHVLSDLLCLAITSSVETSPIPRYVTNWLQLYTTISLENSLRVGEALLISLQTLEGQGLFAGRGAAKDSDCNKLIQLVFSHIDVENIKKFNNYHVVHEKLALDILQEIGRAITSERIISLARALQFLIIKTPEAAKLCMERCEEIRETLVAIITEGGVVPNFRTALNQFIKRLERDFHLNLDDNNENVPPGSPAGAETEDE